MGVSVAEYLGQRTDVDSLCITPAEGTSIPCPFMAADCSKVAQRYKPVCSVRLSDGRLWIVCRNLLCSTRKDVPLSPHQLDVLLNVAKCVFGTHVTPSEVCVKREVAMPVAEDAHYSADFVMVINPQSVCGSGQSRVVLEMQGGGETSNTGELTGHIEAWECAHSRSNRMLSQVVGKCSPIITNAWRRQQEQFLVKGNIAQLTGGGIVFCVGSPIYDYLIAKLQKANLPKLRIHNWTLALIAFSEDTRPAPNRGPIPMSVDITRLMFTNYASFTQALINQGNPAPAIFKGQFQTLAGGTVVIP